jgi:hypothetical protein
MPIVWILLFLPAVAGQPPVSFPESFSSQQACLELGGFLSAADHFTCIAQPAPVELAESESTGQLLSS